MATAVSNNPNLTPSQLLRGVSQPFVPPRLASDYASSQVAKRIQQSARQQLLGTGTLYDFLKSFDQQRLDELCQQGRRLGDCEKSDFVKLLSLPYIRQLDSDGTPFAEQQGFLTMNPLQSSLFCSADFLSFDATFHENREYPVTLQVGTFSHAIDCYVVFVAKYRSKKDNLDMYKAALSKIVQTASDDAKQFGFQHFSWSNLSSIVVDWSHTQCKAIKEAILAETSNGEKIMERLHSGCAVHFARNGEKKLQNDMLKNQNKETFSSKF